MNVKYIALKRIDGKPWQTDKFKRGYRVNTLNEADEALADIAATVPDGETHRVAYEVRPNDGDWLTGGYHGVLYGRIAVGRGSVTRLADQIYEDYAAGGALV